MLGFDALLHDTGVTCVSVYWREKARSSIIVL